MSPVKRSVHVDPSKTHHDDKLNKSLENLGLTKSRPLLRLGDKPLFVVDTDGRHTVYKKVCISSSKSPYDEQSWFEFCMREYMFMRQLQGHPNIVEVETAFIDTDHLIINMEFTDRGDLFTILTDYRDDSGHALAFNEKKAKYVMRQILLGVSYMHSKNLAHRDLKLENILYFEKPFKAIKICDFEYTCNVEKDDVDILGMFLGSWTAISPELVLAAIAYNSDVNQLRTEFQQYKDGEPTVFAWDWRKSDIWACGVMLFTCLHGAFPYYGVDRNDNESLHAMHHDMFDKPLSVHSSISEPCREVLKAMLHLDHETRKTANEILEMEWFKGVGGLSRSGGSSVSLSGSGTLL